MFGETVHFDFTRLGPDLAGTRRDAVVLYHDNCMDGMGSAWAFQYLMKGQFDEVSYVPVSYGKRVPDVAFDPNPTHLFILDFSYSRPELLALTSRYNTVTILDHHKTAQEDLSNWTDKPENLEIVFDMNRSGAGLTWDYFASPHFGRPLLITYIEDRDLWRFKFHESKEVNAYIAAHELNFEDYNQMFYTLSTSFANCVNIGRYLLAAHRKNVQAIVDSCTRDITIAGKSGLVCNCSPMFSSDVGHALVEKSGTFGATYFHGKDDSVKFSLRSKDNCEDVGALAKLFGGGGHRNAAGFELKAPVDGDKGVVLWNLDVLANKDME